MLKLFLAIMLISIEKAVAFSPSPNNVLVLTRSNNENAVYYDANLIKDEFNTKNPLNIYWVLHEKDNKVTGLNNIEKEEAYGVNIKSTSPKEIKFSLKARPKKILTMKLREKGGLLFPYAVLKIDSRDVEIMRVHLNVNLGTLIPTVKEIEYFGVLASTGEKIKTIEKIKD